MSPGLWNPIKRLESFIVENKIQTVDEINEINEEIKREILDAVEFAENSPEPAIDSVVEDIYTDIVEEVNLV
jgi:TPP-dependent pyruvate/acetoin dehydrogenase alpha subunit